MQLQEVLAELESLGNEKMRAHNARRGAGDNQFGVKLGDIRAVARKIKTNHELALALWETGNIDARFLATLVIEPKLLSADELDRMVRSVAFDRVADWLNAYVVKNHPDKEALRERWMLDDDPMAQRAGWNLTAQRVAGSPEGLDLAALLDNIETGMAGAAPEAQWTMNTALVEIGVHHADQRERAIAIGETLGLYRDYPVPRGCTSPFAPIGINEMLSRRR